MTVSTTLRTKSYNGNDVTDTFAVPFLFYDSGHLKVTLFDTGGTPSLLTEGADYDVTGEGVMAGGEIVLGTPPATGEVLRIDRTVTLEQAGDLVNMGAFYPEILEMLLDLVTMLAGQEPSGPIYTTATRPAASETLNGRNIIVKDSGAAGVRQVCLETSTPGSYAWKTYTLT